MRGALLKAFVRQGRPCVSVESLPRFVCRQFFDLIPGRPVEIEFRATVRSARRLYSN